MKAMSKVIETAFSVMGWTYLASVILDKNTHMMDQMALGWVGSVIIFHSILVFATNK